MDILLYIFSALTVLTAVVLVLQYIKGGMYGRNNLVFISSALLAVLVSWIAGSALPDNYMLQRIVAYGWGLIAVLSVILKANKKSDYFTAARLLLTVSLVGGVLDLFFFG